MKRSQRLRRSQDFAHARAKGRNVHGSTLTLTWVANDRSQSRFGFVVGKRVGPAVTRNLVKRRLRAIIQTRCATLSPGFDIVINARPSAAERSFVDLGRDVERLLDRAHLTPLPEHRPVSPAPAASDMMEEKS